MANDWISQGLLTKLCSSSAIYDNRVEFGFGWWFAYIWKEIGARNRDEEKMKEVIATVFADRFPADIAQKSYAQKRAAGDAVAAGFTALLPEPADLRTNPLKYRALLTKLLNIGFREMPAQAVSLPGAGQVKEMFLDRISALKHGNRVPVAIGYRGDTRDYDTVISHSGALSRADLGLNNMNQPWHPFSDPVVGGKTYGRGASGDNCLYSVLSIGNDVSVPVGFPLIEDANVYTLPALPATEPVKDLSKWNFKIYREAQTGKTAPLRLAKAAVTGVGKTSGLFLASEMFIYAVKVKKAVHTQDFVEQEFAMPQNQCRERGVRAVKLKNFLAGARIRRIHLGPARMCGVVGFVQEVKYCVGGRWVPNVDAAQFGAAHFYGDVEAGRSALALIQARLAPNGTVIGERDVSMAPNPLPGVTAIEQWNLTFDQFTALKQQYGAQLYYGRVA